jgi:hypothetical protein
MGAASVPDPEFCGCQLFLPFVGHFSPQRDINAVGEKRMSQSMLATIIWVAAALILIISLARRRKRKVLR